MTEQYEYQVGDKGVLKNGEDTYRILATDCVFQQEELVIHALVVSNYEGNDNVTNIFESSMDFRLNGTSLANMSGKPDPVLGTDEYDLTPPTE